MIVANCSRGTATAATEGAVPASIAASTMEQSPALIVTRIYPVRGWRLINFSELWQYRELIYFFTWRDVKVRYKQTTLGATWAILQPLMMMAVFTIVFSRMAGVSSGDVPYSLFAYAGLLPWTFFAAALTGAGNSVVASEGMITKIYFPRLAVPFAKVGAAAVDFVVAFGLLIVMMVWCRIAPGWGLLLLPAVFGLILLAALGIGVLLAALNVVYRDFRHVVPFLVQLWMFATPTVYMQPKAASGGWASVLLMLNPMNTLVSAFRASILGGPIPWGPLGIISAAVVLVFLLGCLYFHKVEDQFADVI
jgi:lipopolysaccharide transport system permease protein